MGFNCLFAIQENQESDVIVIVIFQIITNSSTGVTGRLTGWMMEKQRAGLSVVRFRQQKHVG